jgi:pyruvate formate lyase activating enzyme
MLTATIFDIQRNSYVDGPGIRTTVFFKGCNLRCLWCHNPESQSPKPQMMLYKNKCTGCGKCKEKCPNHLESCELCGKCTIYCPHDAREICGKEYTVDEVMREILKDKVFYENSGGGVTFSGGECMLQIDFLEEILKACKENGIHTAVDTAGCVPFEYFERILPCTDLFLYDVKCFDSEKHKQYTGVGNELILENLKRLLATDKSVWIRIPIIPTINDTEEELQGIKEYIFSCGKPAKFELLPYHAMGEHKYAAIGKETQIFSVPGEEKMKHFKNIFS